MIACMQLIMALDPFLVHSCRQADNTGTQSFVPVLGPCCKLTVIMHTCFTPLASYEQYVTAMPQGKASKT